MEKSGLRSIETGWPVKMGEKLFAESVCPGEKHVIDARVFLLLVRDIAIERIRKKASYRRKVPAPMGRSQKYVWEKISGRIEEEVTWSRRLKKHVS